jgi:Ala-tRNA(Pro) deacylase
MPVKKLREMLENRHIPYKSIIHPQTFTAQKTAQSTHTKGRELAKTVVVRMDGRLCMVVLPAHHRVDLDHLKEATGTEAIALVPEREFSMLFPECEIGAMPPFGNLYGMDVMVEHELAQDEEIAFNAGTHTEVIRMAYKDYETLVHPSVGDFCD